MPDQQGSGETKLPINSKSRGPAIEGLPGAGRKERRHKPQPADGNRPRINSDSKAWADYTPTPFQDFSGTPWSQAHKMMAQGWGHGAFGSGMPPGYMVGVQEPDRPGDAQLPDHRFAHASPTPGGPTPKVWPNTPTPTPGAQPSMPYGFGVPGMHMPGLPLQRPPNFNMIAEAARDAASAAAMAAAAAGSPNGDESPSRSPLEEGGGSSGPGAPFNDDYTGDFDSPVIPGLPTMPPGSVPPLFPGPMGPAGLGPSRGSQFHGTGKCRPCAWFHKPQGCQSAQSCSYCHLCPEGELKSRKKLKVAAMRMGALTPAKPSKRDTGAARTLKLNPLL